MAFPTRTVLRIGGGLLLLLLLVAGAAMAYGSSRLAATHAVDVAPLALDSASVTHGAHLASIYGCRDCHGADLAGQLLDDVPPFRLVAPNLTPAGVGALLTDATAWDRAIRHGVGHDGRALFVMPSGAYHKVSDAEAADLIAYLRTLPPVENENGRIVWKPLGRLLAAGPIDVAAGVHAEPTTATSPRPDSTLAYGAYIVGMMCTYCHGPNVEGQVTEGSELLAPDLRSAAGWTPEQFHTALTTGVTPSGHRLDPQEMPWTATREMTYAEREGIRRYLVSLAQGAG